MTSSGKYAAVCSTYISVLRWLRAANIGVRFKLTLVLHEIYHTKLRARLIDVSRALLKRDNLVKVKFIIEQATNVQRGSRCMALLFL